QHPRQQMRPVVAIEPALERLQRHVRTSRRATRDPTVIATPRSEAMRHAGPDTLERIPRLLAELRARTALRERRPGPLQLRSRAFLHFHDDPSGIYADVRLADDFVRMRVTTRSEQSDLLDRIDECLSAVESRADRRRKETPRTRRRR